MSKAKVLHNRHASARVGYEASIAASMKTWYVAIAGTSKKISSPIKKSFFMMQTADKSQTTLFYN